MTRPLDELFFKYFFPNVTSHAKTIDKYISSRDAQYHERARNDKIVFHDEMDDDPDWKVKQAYLIMIAAVCEIENGVEILWKKGQSGGQHVYPDFGKHMHQNMFKCFAWTAILTSAIHCERLLALSLFIQPQTPVAIESCVAVAG